MDIIKLFRARRLAHVVGVATVVASAFVGAPAPPASADPCPDVEVVFARGTSEPPGIGMAGRAFVDALQAQAGNKSVAVYPVNYAASSDFGNRLDFVQSVVDGVKDAATHVEASAAACPQTRIVLGGYSQGAVVSGFTTANALPKEIPADLAEYTWYAPKPMPPTIANHVAALVLFGKPSSQFMADIGAPPIAIGPAYVAKTIELCVPDDTICNGAPAGGPSFAHITYGSNGMADQAATFVVGRL
ncbi:cutinase [Mycolicibacterium sp. TY66]|uniref:cutinase family protein n=1 Tax=Mycobacteriaceae TaxID=1762 RepID=UPI001BB4CEE3|nr:MULTISPECIES: cutinase family protein [unclassified Mycolicibacterium]BCI81425.1 cutinase [Mycolicibacterium sp. TY66]BCJ80913.1 cutinase [Mycolicibacterium sp. TY81]